MISRDLLLQNMLFCDISHMAITTTRVRQAKTARRGCGSSRPRPPGTQRRMQRRPPRTGRAAGKSLLTHGSHGLSPCTGAITDIVTTSPSLSLVRRSNVARTAGLQPHAITLLRSLLFEIILTHNHHG